MCGAGAGWCFFVCLHVDVDRHSDDRCAGGAAGCFDDNCHDFTDDVVYYPFYFFFCDHHDYFGDGADDDHHDAHQPSWADEPDEPDAGWLSFLGLR